MRVFDEDGRATPFLDAIAERLGALDAGFRASGDFFAVLRDHELLEPFTLEVPLDDGSKHSLVGYHIIAEAKLQALHAVTPRSEEHTAELQSLMRTSFAVFRLKKKIIPQSA